MSLAYKVLYGVGLTPWEKMDSPLANRQISALFDREEAGRQIPYGPALDLGCGSGIWAVKLAARGWQVTGVDLVPKALRRARERACEADVELRLIEGDVTSLGSSGIGSGFQLLLDFGCFHDELSDAQRRAEAREASAAAAPGASLLLTAFVPGRRGPLPRGASREDIEAAFVDWSVIDEERMDTYGAPKWVQKAEPSFYRLRRN
jgi:SAM-dependent methyltransferase